MNITACRSPPLRPGGGVPTFLLHMWRLLPLLSLLAVLTFATSGCSLFGASKRTPKSTARIYEGDSPNVRMTNKREAPGGRLQQYR
jgi:hypothetical protein